MNVQHRNQAPRPQNRHRMTRERKSLKKPEATGSAGRCEPGRGRLTAPSLCPAPFSHPFRCPYPGIFSTLPTQGRIRLFGACGGSFPHPGEKTASQALTGQRNPVLFRRKRRVLRTRGFLRERAAGSVLHTGPNLAFWGPGSSASPPWGETRHYGPHRAKQAGPGFVLLGAKKPLPGFVGQRPGGCLIHLFSKNVPQRPHKRKAMRSVSWSVTRRKTGFPRMQAPT